MIPSPRLIQRLVRAALVVPALTDCLDLARLVGNRFASRLRVAIHISGRRSVGGLGERRGAGGRDSGPYRRLVFMGLRILVATKYAGTSKALVAGLTMPVCALSVRTGLRTQSVRRAEVVGRVDLL